MVRSVTLFLAFAGVAGLILSIATGNPESWLKTALNEVMGGLSARDPFAEWRYEVAAYATLALMTVLAWVGLLRLPGQDKVHSVRRLWLAGGLIMAIFAPFVVDAISARGVGYIVAILLAAGTGLIISHARPPVPKGARREFHAGWNAIASIVSLITLMAGVHAAWIAS